MVPVDERPALEEAAAGNVGASLGPRVSIGLPVYNGEDFLEAALESLVSQTYWDLEVIISDNASIDRTEAICRSYAEKDARIRYFRQPSNLGGAPNFNFVFRQARGEYFKWSSHDDVIQATYLERCLDVLDHDQQAVLACPRLVYIDEQGRVLRRQRRADLSIRATTAGSRAEQLVRHQLDGDDIYWSIFGVIRASVLRTTHMLGSYVAADQVLLMELALRGDFVQVPEDLYHRRDHPRASMSQHRTPRERAKWFNTQNDPKIVLPHWTLLWKHLAAVRTAELRRDVRWRCYRAVLTRFLHQWRALGGEVKFLGADLMRLVQARPQAATRATGQAASLEASSLRGATNGDERLG